jgi:hypothetical protein
MSAMDKSVQLVGIKDAAGLKTEADIERFLVRWRDWFLNEYQNYEKTIK